MTNKINWYKNQIVLNVLAKDLQNAKDIYKAANSHVIVGILSKNFATNQEAIEEMTLWAKAIDNNISIGLGSGDPKQTYMVAELSKKLNPNHANQVFTGVGLTRGDIKNSDVFINCLVSPTGKPGWVKINTGPLSEQSDDAIVPVETAILLAKDMGANSLKFFNMQGLKYIEDYKSVALACGKLNFGLEPTGGIDLTNFEEILKIAIDAKVPKIIPHVYSSIIDKETKETKIIDIDILLGIISKY